MIGANLKRPCYYILNKNPLLVWKDRLSYEASRKWAYALSEGSSVQHDKEKNLYSSINNKQRMAAIHRFQLHAEVRWLYVSLLSSLVEICTMVSSLALYNIYENNMLFFILAFAQNFRGIRTTYGENHIGFYCFLVRTKLALLF